MNDLCIAAPRRRVALMDAVFDHTRLLEAMLVENHLTDAETQTETLPTSAR